MSYVKEEIEQKNFANPDEIRELPKTHIALINSGDHLIMRLTLQPGWKWTECVKPTVGTQSCQIPHLNIILSGSMKIIMDDGTEQILSPGDVATIPPGHTGEVLGNEPCIALDITGGETYGKKS